MKSLRFPIFFFIICTVLLMLPYAYATIMELDIIRCVASQPTGSVPYWVNSTTNVYVEAWPPDETSLFYVNIWHPIDLNIGSFGWYPLSNTMAHIPFSMSGKGETYLEITFAMDGPTDDGYYRFKAGAYAKSEVLSKSDSASSSFKYWHVE